MKLNDLFPNYDTLRGCFCETLTNISTLTFSWELLLAFIQNAFPLFLKFRRERRVLSNESKHDFTIDSYLKLSAAYLNRGAKIKKEKQEGTL